MRQSRGGELYVDVCSALHLNLQRRRAASGFASGQPPGHAFKASCVLHQRRVSYGSKKWHEMRRAMRRQSNKIGRVEGPTQQYQAAAYQASGGWSRKARAWREGRRALQRAAAPPRSAEGPQSVAPKCGPLCSEEGQLLAVLASAAPQLGVEVVRLLRGRGMGGPGQGGRLSSHTAFCQGGRDAHAEARWGCLAAAR